MGGEMTRVCWSDTETFSPTPINHGTHRYAEDVEVMLWAYAFDDGPVKVWDLTEHVEMPADLAEAVNDPDTLFYFHNSHFDRTVLRHNGFGIPVERVRDTMVKALAHGLPGSLGDLCEILRVDTDKAKDKAGKALISLFCKPAGKHLKRGRATRETHPADWARFIEYAALDIAAMREVDRKLPVWNYQGRELDLWHLDQRINDRGVAIDLELAEAALRAVDLAQVSLREQVQTSTNGEVDSATRRDKMLEHILAEYGIALPDMTKSTLERRIADPDLPEGLRELLRIRLQATTTSTSKYKTLIRGTSSDGRLRGLLQFCGASRTGRWAGRLFQPQNLPSRGLLPHHQIMDGIEAMKADCADLLFDNVMKLTSSAIRGCLVPAPGKKFVVVDLSNIEGRDQAWLAGEQWKLRAFREFDTVQTVDGRWLTGDQYAALCRANRAPELALNDKDEPVRKGHDLYKMSYGKSFNVDPSSVTKDQRQVGKVQELALGYEGGVGAFVTFAANYNIDLDDLAGKAVQFIPGEVMGQAKIMLDWHRSKGRNPPEGFGMDDRTWLVCESFKLGWRAGHQEIAAYWKQLDACVRAAIESPGRTIPCGKVRIRRDGAWLRIVLPSGRALCYPSPMLQAEKRKRADTETVGLEVIENEQPAPGGRTKITYMGINQYSKKWTRLDTYGGKIFENICQAVARDVMAHNMPAIEEAGYAIVLTVHDEVICEAPDLPEYNADHLAAMLAANPPWAPDMPLAAAGFEATRYRKE